ncbi:hypothetical protein KUV85_10025 [Nocardioides panacisoli]|uniref:hypothetical protein n=1 Tax=Nocardioides panacisoli TaxID=627624 RepID=UPI001C637EDE|nr:hypothetical protein [Nocardioides panacisoli]QYJ02676.1 hypothetical protein KUV85_10025 [Nocardioides panacisoli]
MRSRAAGVALVGILLFVTGLLGWRGIATEATDAVRVDASVPRCGGTEVGTASWAGSRLPAIPLEAGMECRLAYRLHNTGDTDLTLTGFHQAISGPEGGAAFRVDAINGGDPEQTGDVEARWTGEVALPAGDSTSLRIRVVFRPAGCTARGSVLWAGSFATVRAWGRDRDIALPTATLYRGTADSHCPAATG